jgi:hypothetical protein
MNKLMLLAAGALTALAFAALPAAASATEYIAHCEVGASCSGTVTGGLSELENNTGEKIHCTAVEGTATATSGTSTGTVELSFTGCRETVTFFRFSCSNTATAGKITTNTMPSHLINLEHGATTPGIKLTEVNVTFTCAGFSKKTVTGKVIGHLHDPNCGTFQSTHSIGFETSGPGTQKYTQTETTGTTTDLVSNTDEPGAFYHTSGQRGTGTIHWTNNKVKITC